MEIILKSKLKLYFLFAFFDKRMKSLILHLNFMDLVRCIMSYFLCVLCTKCTFIYVQRAERIRPKCITWMTWHRLWPAYSKRKLKISRVTLSTGLFSSKITLTSLRWFTIKIPWGFSRYEENSASKRIVQFVFLSF